MITDDDILSMSTQELIDSGQAWLLEGHIGRQCMAAIDNGYAVLGQSRHRDYWGSLVPARSDIVPGSVGSQLYAHNLMGHETPYVRCRRGTCKLPRRSLYAKHLSTEIAS